MMKVYRNMEAGTGVEGSLVMQNQITAGDGYNVYMYLDNELMDIEHLCCLAHARAKFKYAHDQGVCRQESSLELIAKLYGMEETYRREKLTADEFTAEGTVRKRRKSSRVKDGAL